MFSFKASDHLDYLRGELFNTYSPTRVAEWMCTNTFIGGKPFSFKDHEYQEKIVMSNSPVIVVKKCSQVGISEMSFRRTLALLDLIPGFTTIYTLPTAKFAANVMKTRIDDIIRGSSRLTYKADRAVDNTEIKKIGDSYLYLKGTYGSAAAISIPADLIVADEVDFSDQEVLSNYQSRLTHSKYKWRFSLSTPTVEGFGIDEQFSSSRRTYNLVKCNHCNHRFYPSFREHVVLPGYNAPLLDLTKETLAKYDHRKAYLACPHCGKSPDLSPKYREWVVENSDQNFIAEGYQISPFDAPAFITVPYLLEASVSYKRKVDFINFNLGECAADDESGIQLEDLLNARKRFARTGITHYIFGADMGQTCHLLVGGVDFSGKVHIVHMERCRYTEFEKRYFDLKLRYRFRAALCDSQPYTDLIHRLQQRCPILFGAVYTANKSLEMFRMREQDEEGGRALLDVRQVNVNRNYSFDVLMENLRRGDITIYPADEDELAAFGKHLTDMKRVRRTDVYGEELFAWQKSQAGNDHYHHALLYLFTASYLCEVEFSNSIWLPPSMSVRRIRSLV